MGREINDRGLHALGRQIFRHLQADEAASGHHGPLDLPSLHRFPQADGIVGRAHYEHILQVQPLDGRHKGGRAGGDDQLVIAVLRHLPGVEVLRLHHVPVRMDGHGLGLSLDAGPGEGSKLLRRVDDQLALCLDHPAHVVGQAAARIGDVLPLGKDRHLAGAVLPHQLGGSLSTGGYAA